MRGAIALAWLVLRRGGRTSLLGAGLTMAAVAISTGLLLFAVAANQAFADRADRQAWRHPVAAGEQASAEQALSTAFVRGQPVTVVDLAALDGNAPVPPGMPRFPEPGETWMSPALAELATNLPDTQLADRFPGERPAGLLDREALAHPDELVAVVGQKAGSAAMTGQRFNPQGHPTASPTRIDGYASAVTAGQPGTYSQIYTILVRTATVLVVVPLLVFGGAAARLTVARRDQRLAALRLVGATGRQVVAMTAAEAVLTAVVGALAGAVLYAAAIPALAQIRINGGPWFFGDLWVGVLPLLAVLAAVPLLVGASAVVGLRRVAVSPLGVARRQTPPALKAIRVVVFAALLVVFVIVAVATRTGSGIALGLLGLAFLALNLVGPWVVGILGRIAAATARRPAALLAARRLVDDPRSAWRTVSGIALTGFVAGFLSLSPNPGSLDSQPANELTLRPVNAGAAAVAGRAEERLAAAGVDANVDVTGEREDRAGRHRDVTVTVADEPAAVDRARTALAGTLPGQYPVSPATGLLRGETLFTDMRTGTLVVLAVSFLIAITSAGITAASAVLDRRRTYALLRLAGTPLRVLDRARRREVLLPLAVMGGGSLLTGMLCAVPLLMQATRLPGLGLLAGCVVAGTAGIVGAGALSTPLLRRVTANPARPD